MTTPCRTGQFYREVDRFRRDLILTTLQAHGGNRTHAARTLGMRRNYLVALLKRLRARP